MSKMKEILSLAMAAVLTAGIAIGGTVAYLQDSDGDVNVMTLGNVKIEQHEYERGVNADGTYETVATNRGTGYKLVDFTQAKPLFPAVGTVTGWDSTRVFFEQFGEGHELGAMDVLDGIQNVQDKFVFVENTGKSDAYVRTIIAFEAGAYTVEQWDALIATSAHVFWDYTILDTVVNIDDNNYVIMECNYTGASGANGRHPDGIVHPGDYTYNNLAQVYMKSVATNEDCEALDGNKNGTYDILVLSQAVQADGFADAVTALKAGFGEVNTANVQTWFGDVGLPTVVANAEELRAAIANGGAIVFGNDITLTGNAADDIYTLEKDVHINGNGYALLMSDSEGFSFYPFKLKNGQNNTVTIENLDIISNDVSVDDSSQVRGVSIDATSNLTFNLINCEINLSASKSGYAHALNIRSVAENIKVNVDSCKLVGGTAVNWFASDSELNINNSTLISSNSDVSDPYYQIVRFQNAAKNNKITITNCHLDYQGGVETDKAYAILNTGTNNEITVTNCTYGQSVDAEYSTTK